MTQAQLNREVARATGESVVTIARLGFLLAESDLDLGGPLDPQVLDWDAFQEVGNSRPECGFDHVGL